MPSSSHPSSGDYLRRWRRHRRMSQLDLALEAEVSQRHVSFIESGRAAPSRAMLLRLAERLDVPLGERNAMLLAAGYAPVFSETLFTDPSLAAPRRAIERVLRGHEPFPALAVDGHWTLLAANSALSRLIGTVEDAALLRPPVNVLRLSLHPGGMAPRIVNLEDWRAHVLDRLRRQATAAGDPALMDLRRELSKFGSDHRREEAESESGGLFVPLRIATDLGVLSFLSTTTVFGAPRDVTIADLAIEAFFPADEETARILRHAASDPDDFA